MEKHPSGFTEGLSQVAGAASGGLQVRQVAGQPAGLYAELFPEGHVEEEIRLGALNESWGDADQVWVR